MWLFAHGDYFLERRFPVMSNRKRKDHSFSQPETEQQKKKIVRKNYHVTSQTAYHITRLALQENTTEGHIIDKIMRNYLVLNNSKTFL